MSILTVLLDDVPGDRLQHVSIDKLHGRLRKRLIRAGYTAAIGGTEADFDPASGNWMVHVHLLAFDDSISKRDALSEMCKRDGIERAVKR